MKSKPEVYVIAFVNRNLCCTARGSKAQLKAITLALLATDWTIALVWKSNVPMARGRYAMRLQD